MTNTFWTIINGDYCRIKDNELYIAPILNDKADTDKSIKVVSIDSDSLELVNLEFGGAVRN